MYRRWFGMVVVRREPPTLGNILGHTTKGVRTDRVAICFPSGVPFLLLGKGICENVATRQLGGVYPAEPTRLAAFLGVGVVVHKRPCLWELGLTVAGVEVARCTLQSIDGWEDAIEITCEAIHPVLPYGKNLEKFLA